MWILMGEIKNGKGKTSPLIFNSIKLPLLKKVFKENHGNYMRTDGGDL